MLGSTTALRGWTRERLRVHVPKARWVTAAAMFVRIHRSAIVSVRYIMQIETVAQGDYVLTPDNLQRPIQPHVQRDHRKWVSNRP